jgi:hypothetical protein
MRCGNLIPHFSENIIPDKCCWFFNLSGARPPERLKIHLKIGKHQKIHYFYQSDRNLISHHNAKETK